MKRFFKVTLALCLALGGPAHATDECNEALALDIWTVTEARLNDLLGVEVKQPPRFLIYPTAQDLPGNEDDTVLGHYDSASGLVSVVCTDQDERVFELDVRHESTHYYLEKAYGITPTWLDEGLAAYMEAGSLGEGTLKDHLNPKRLNEFIYLLRKSRVPPVSDILEGKGFSSQSQFYAASWALVFALLHHSDSDAQLKRRALVLHLLQAIKAGESDPDKINQKLVSLILQDGDSLPKWQAKWHRQMWDYR